jgi:hypothetical protein
MAYPCFSKPFEIYTDASTLQLGAVITQENRPIAFFSQNSLARNIKIHHYQTRALSQRSSTECCGWQQINDYTDHKNLTRDSLGLTSDRVPDGGFSKKNMPLRSSIKKEYTIRSQKQFRDWNMILS